jgi:quinol-cytochrome oxidoreductase complex cytochrome b subunit
MRIQTRKLVEWVDSRIGLTETMLRPGPDYSLNVFYWLGALMVIAFLVQGVTGVLMLLYYVPTVDQAYASTQFIIKYVPLGGLIETIHLYSAYAMILLAFMHLMRGYFVSVQKKPRELMWIVGMLMGLVVLGFGLTGYLLPWTVISKSATDVTIGMLSFLPGQLAPILKFLIAGPGSDAAELSRFFDLHIVVLPAVFIVLLAFKMYMFEIHGAAEPATGVVKKVRQVPWFPDILLYFSMLSGVFLFILLAASVLFPLSLPPQFSPEAASSYVPQPEWYFLWIYQILKFTIFEGPAVVVPLVVLSLVLAVLLLLPIIDRGSERNPARRPIYSTLGVMVVFELIVLSAWGFVTPGQVISDSQAIVIVAGIALSTAFLSLLTYRTRRMLRPNHTVGRSLGRFIETPFRFPILTVIFVLLLAISSGAFAIFVNLLPSAASNPLLLLTSILVAASSLYWMSRIVQKLAVRQHNIGVPS